MDRTKRIKTIREGLKLMEQQLAFMESLDGTDLEVNYRTIKHSMNNSKLLLTNVGIWNLPLNVN